MFSSVRLLVLSLSVSALSLSGCVSNTAFEKSTNSLAQTDSTSGSVIAGATPTPGATDGAGFPIDQDPKAPGHRAPGSSGGPIPIDGKDGIGNGSGGGTLPIGGNGGGKDGSTGGSPNPSPSGTPKPVATSTPSPTSSPTPTNPQIVTDSILVPALDETKVDMVLVVDNSGSMADKQAILARNFAAFIEQFQSKDLDFRIAVISTDVTAPGTYWTKNDYASYASASRGNFLSRTAGEKWLTKNSSSLDSKFRSNVQLGTKGSGSEQGLNSLMYALDDSHLAASSGFNDGFLRPDSLLSVIVVSDEDEDIVNSDNQSPEVRIERVASRLAQLRPSTSKGFRFDFVVDLDAQPVARSYPLPSNITNSYPNVYLKAAAKFGAKTYNVHGNFADDLANIGADIASQAESQHKLSKLPVVSTIVVKIDGELITADASNGFVYHADKNSIELMGSALRTSPGKTVTISYTVR